MGLPLAGSSAFPADRTPTDISTRKLRTEEDLAMRAQRIAIGRISFSPVRAAPRRQLGGRRPPPHGPRGSRRWNLRLPMPRKGHHLHDWFRLCSHSATHRC
jgi:hypothetical protein